MNTKDMEDGTKRTEGFLGRLTGGFGGLASVVGGVGLALGGLGAIKKATEVSADFESQVNILGTAVGDAGVSLDTYSDAALKMGADTSLVGISASQSVEAMTNFAKAGLSVTDMFGGAEGLNSYLEEGTALSGALRAAVDLQAASELDLAAASDAISVAMATYGIPAEEAVAITNSFVQAADASVASVPDLVQSLRTFGPVAARMGLSLEDTNNALAILSQRGITGATAGTQMKSMFMAISGPSKNAREAMEGLGIAFYDAEGNLKSMPDILGNVNEAMAGLTQQAKDETLKDLFGTYGGVAASALLEEGAEGWAFMGEATEAASTASETAAARTQGLNASLEALEGTVETFMIKAGTPLIEKFFTPLVGFAATVVESVIPMLDDLGPAMDGVSGFVQGIIGGVGDMASDAGAAAEGEGGGFSLDALIGNLFAGADTWLDENSAAIGPKIGGMIDGAFAAGITWIENNFQPLVADLFAAFKTIIEEAPALLEEHGPTIGETYGELLGKVVRLGITALVKIVATIGKELWGVVSDIITAGASGEEGAAGTLATAYLDTMKAVLNGFITGLTGDPQWGESLKNFFIGDPDGIITKAKQSIADEVENMKQAGKDMVQGMIDGVKEAPGKLVDAFADAVGAPVKWVKKMLGIESPSTVFRDIGGYVIEGLGLGISEGIPQIEGPIGDVMGVFDSIIGWLTRFAIVAGSQGLEAAGETFEDVADGIEDMSTAFMQFAQGAAAVKAGNLDQGAMVAYLDQWAWAMEQAVLRVKEVVDNVGWKTIGDMKGRATRLGTILESMTTDLSKMKPGDWGVMLAYLDQLTQFLPMLVRGVVGMVTDPETGLGAIVLDDVDKWSGQLAGSFVLMGANLAGIEASEDASFLENAATYLDQVFGFAKLAKERMTALGPEAMAAYEAASEGVPFITGLLGLLGQDLKAELPEEGYEERLPEYLRLVEWSVGLVTPALQRIKAAWGAILEETKEIGGLTQSALGLLGIGMAAELPEEGYREALPGYLELVEWSTGLAVPALQRIKAAWGQALVDTQEIGGLVQSALGLLGLGLAAEMPDETFADTLPDYLGVVEWTTDLVVPAIERIKQRWGELLASAAEAAGNVTSVLGVLGTAFDLQPLAPNWPQLLSDAVAAVGLGADWMIAELQSLRSRWGDDVLAAVAETSGEIQDVMGLFDLAKLFNDLQTQKSDKGTKRIAFENVVDRFLQQLRYASERLKAELPGIKAIWGDMLDVSIELADSFAQLFGNIASAMKAGEEIAASKGLKPQAVLDALDVFQQMVSDVQTIGGFAGLNVTGPNVGDVGTGMGMTPGAPTALTGLDWHGLGGQGTGLGGGYSAGGLTAAPRGLGVAGGGDGSFGAIAEAVRAGIREGLAESRLEIELLVRQRDTERKRFSARLGRLEKMATEMTVSMEAAGV